MTTEAKPTSSADSVVWDLTDLYATVDDPRIEADLKSADGRAAAFEKTYRNKLTGLDAPDLAAAVDELQAIVQLMDTPVIYAHLLHAAKSDDPANGRLLSSVMETSSAIRNRLVFFELEWASLDDKTALPLITLTSPATGTSWKRNAATAPTSSASPRRPCWSARPTPAGGPSPGSSTRSPAG